MFLKGDYIGTDAIEKVVGQDLLGGARFAPENIADAVKMEVWCTKFENPEEYTEFRLIDATGGVIAIRRVEGY